MLQSEVIVYTFIIVGIILTILVSIIIYELMFYPKKKLRTIKYPDGSIAEGFKRDMFPIAIGDYYFDLYNDYIDIYYYDHNEQVHVMVESIAESQQIIMRYKNEIINQYKLK